MSLKKIIKKVRSKLTGQDRVPDQIKTTWAKTSYSQCGEDLIVKFIFDELHIKQPTYLDIGAHHPYNYSNTALFYESGSNGVNIEPDPVLFKEISKYRINDVNLNIGIDTEQTEADFYLISTPTLNTFSKKEAEGYKNYGDYSITNIVKIPVDNLSNIIDNYCNGKFPDFLTVDAEGVDEIIIKSIDFKNNYPIVICIETLSFAKFGEGKKNTTLINHILKKGYKIYADTHINTIFIRDEYILTNTKSL